MIKVMAVPDHISKVVVIVKENVFFKRRCWEVEITDASFWGIILDIFVNSGIGLASNVYSRHNPEGVVKIMSWKIKNGVGILEVEVFNNFEVL